MSVLIRGMKMPASCYDCDLCSESMDSERNVYWTCPVLNMDVEKYERMEDCPLVEVPEPHGRLIDADALHKLFEDQWHYLQVLDWNENPTAEAVQSGINWCINTMHDDAPTIIPASEEGE